MLTDGSSSLSFFAPIQPKLMMPELLADEVKEAFG